MRIFILQHADAVSSDIDPERPLSELGISQSRRAARFLSTLAARPDRIIHSGKLRALQTAEIIAVALGGIPLEDRGYLNPDDDVSIILDDIHSMAGNPLIVGHMPFVRRLALDLLQVPAADHISFANASPLVLCAERDRFQIELYAKNDLLP